MRDSGCEAGLAGCGSAPAGGSGATKLITWATKPPDHIGKLRYLESSIDAGLIDQHDKHGPIPQNLHPGGLSPTCPVPLAVGGSAVHKGDPGNGGGAPEFCAPNWANRDGTPGVRRRCFGPSNKICGGIQKMEGTLDGVPLVCAVWAPPPFVIDNLLVMRSSLM